MKFKSFLIASAAALLAFAGCQSEEPDLGLPDLTVSRDTLVLPVVLTPEDVQYYDTLSFIATRDWTASSEDDWIAIDPDRGSASGDERQEIRVTVLPNTGYDKTGTVKISIGFTDFDVTVISRGDKGSPEDLILYGNDFDKEAAVQEGTAWPYLDKTECWKNAKGSGLSDVTYAYSGISVRNNSNSSGSYSDYAGSGVNNLFFGKDSYFAVKDILTGGNTDIRISFGSEKYDGNDKEALFDKTEFPVLVSADNQKWVSVDYVFNGTAAGRWNTAEATITVPAGTEKISVLVQAKKASVYRLDDLRLEITETSGQTIDFATGTEINIGGGTGGGTGGDDGGQTGEAIFTNDFDKEGAAQEGTSWPYLDKSECWKNEKGSGIANISYAYSGISVRNNSNSNGSYSDYAGSGVNNLFFGKDAYFAVKDIKTGGSTDIHISFGTEKYDGNDKAALFDKAEFPVFVSADNQKWVSVDYVFNGTAAGRWNTAEATITVPAGTEKISVLVQAKKASVYRLDDLQLEITETSGQTIDFATGTEINIGGGTGGGTGGDDGGQTGGGSLPDGTLLKIEKLSTSLSWVADTLSTYGIGFKGTGKGVTVAYYKDKATTSPVAPEAKYDNIKVYKGSIFIVKLDSGATIKGIRLTCSGTSSSPYTYDMDVIQGGGTAVANTSNYTVLWSGGSATEFIAKASGGQIRPHTIEIVY